GFAAGRRGCLTSSDSLFSFAPPFRSAYAIPEGGNPVGQPFLIRTGGGKAGRSELGGGGKSGRRRGEGRTETARTPQRAADRRSAGMRRGFTAPRPAAAGCCRAPRANRPPALRAACP